MYAHTPTYTLKTHSSRPSLRSYILYV